MTGDEPKKRGGSKKGRAPWVKIARDEGDDLKKHDIWLLDSEYNFLRLVGDGNASHGMRKMIAAIRSLIPSA
jgi:hypothetical protein